jgi:phosphatidylinositol alpha-1,6-mannosyltransferase
MPSLLVTNDFPPKVGGIQSYLYELWRRLPPDHTTVYTTPYEGTSAWDAQQSFRVERAREKVLLPTRALARNVDALAREVNADVIFLDPMLPLGLIGPWLRAAPYVVVAHGAEITVYGQLPVLRQLSRRVLRQAAAIVAAGGYPAEQAMRIGGDELRGVVIPPGVDVERFIPIAHDNARPEVVGVSRLVPRKGFDVVIDATRDLDVDLVIAGAGRDRDRLERRAHGDARFLGRVPDAELPALYASADVFAMCCRERWFGLEAEGFGIVFLEAAACGVPSVAGRSGGAHEAVVDGETGFVVGPRDTRAVRDAIRTLTTDPDLRAKMGEAARRRACEAFAYDRLVGLLEPVARGELPGRLRV